MRVTISRVITPITTIGGQTKKSSEYTKRVFVHELFLDPWASEHDKKKFFHDFVLKIGHILDENTMDVEVIPEVIYFINGIGHFHQDGVSYASEVDKFSILDKATYEGLCAKYAAGAKIDLTRRYKGSMRTKANNRVYYDKRYNYHYKVNHSWKA